MANRLRAIELAALIGLASLNTSCSQLIGWDVLEKRIFGNFEEAEIKLNTNSKDYQARIHQAESYILTH